MFILFCTACVFLFLAGELNNSLSCTDSVNWLLVDSNGDVQLW